jgi:hypothetical protein
MQSRSLFITALFNFLLDFGLYHSLAGNEHQEVNMYKEDSMLELQLF